MVPASAVSRSNASAASKCLKTHPILLWGTPGRIRLETVYPAARASSVSGRTWDVRW